MNTYQEIIAKDRYSKWIDNKRKETWEETVDRYCDFMNLQHVKPYILNMDVMPSMRLMLTSGEAVARENACAYNCAYTIIDDFKRFPEMLYLLMNGSGVGFSVESAYVNCLPAIPETFVKTSEIISVADTRTGWVSAFKDLLNCLNKGQIPYINYNKIRPKGKRLKIFGGRSSGPEILKELFDFIIQKFTDNHGKKFTSLTCFDICCKIAQTVECGGVRRCALICLCDIFDELLLEAKTFENVQNHPYRRFCNISVVVEDEHPNLIPFFNAVYKNKTGEPGIFNRFLAWNKTGDLKIKYGTNPCGEVILRPFQFCNLTEVVCRVNDNLITLLKKIEIATEIGTHQATLTKFNSDMLSEEWKLNSEEDRLLGVSLTGICDCPLLLSGDVEYILHDLCIKAVCVNKEIAKKLNINPAKRITCVKPSGTVSQLVDSSSGIHPRYAPYYIRTVRFSKLNPICRVLIESGIKHEPAIGDENRTEVFYFYVKSPHYKKYTAIDQINRYLLFNKEYADHSVSCTIEYEDSEWIDIMKTIMKNISDISGITFFPKQTYEQGVYMEITKEEYEANNKEISIDWSLLDKYEEEMDFEQETLFQEGDSACVGGACSLI